jgi:uncharacterized damage-inducible protein DinB
MSIANSLLPEFDHELANTRRVLERCPDDKLDFKPHPKSFAMGALATHVANMLKWAVDTLKNDSFDVSPNGAPPPKEEPIKTNAELLATFDKNVKAAREALAATTDEAFMKQWSLKANGKEMFSMPRVAVIRTMIMNHLIHHRAQLTVYLRLNDIPVPAIYGPSADEQPKM